MMFELLIAVLCVRAVAAGVLYPYGSKRGDVKVTGVDDGSRRLGLSTSIRIFGQSYTSLAINTNGVISFSDEFPWYDPEVFPIDSGSTLIAAFWADIDLRYSGKLFYRETSDSKLLLQGQQDIKRAFSSCGGSTFNPSTAVVVTWKAVDYFHELDNPSCLYQDPIPEGCTPIHRRSVDTEFRSRRRRRGTSSRNVLQVVILSDSVETFVVFNYQKVNWLTGDFSGGADGMGGDAARVGFNNEDGSKWYNHPLSGTKSLASSSNIGVRGRWVYRIHGTDLYDPDCSQLT